jgi:WD40 repeat protein
MRHWEWRYLKHLSRVMAGEPEPADLPSSPPDDRTYRRLGGYGAHKANASAFFDKTGSALNARSFGRPVKASSWAASRDGERLARGDLRGKITIWQRSARPPYLPESSLKGPDAEVLCMEFSPDDRQLAAGTGSSLTIFDLESGSVLRTFEPHDNWIRAATYSPDGRRVATASDDMTVRVVDVSRGRLLHTLRGHTKGVNAVGFSPDGRRLASRDSRGALKLWDPETGEQVFDLSLVAEDNGPAGSRYPSGDRWLQEGWVNWWAAPAPTE